MIKRSPKLLENPSPIASSENLGWKSIIVEEFQQPPGKCEPDSWREHTITLCLAPKPLRIWQAMGVAKPCRRLIAVIAVSTLKEIFPSLPQILLIHIRLMAMTIMC